MTKDITLDHVSVSFGDYTAVDDAHLTIAGGEMRYLGHERWWGEMAS